MAWCMAVLVLCLWAAPCTASEGGQLSWWPVQVKSYYGTYDPETKVPGQAATSLSRPKLEEWVPPVKPGGAYTIGVSFPHIKDSYWEAVNYGIIQEARRLGLNVRLVEAGGYDELDRQIQQVRQLVDQQVDGLILGAISYTGNDEIIAETVGKGVPVVEVINDVRAPKVSAKALVSFYEMGFITGEYVAGHAEDNGLDKVAIAFFPGPRDSGWAPESLDGFMAAMDHFPGQVDIVSVMWGDTGADTQRDLIRHSLGSSGNVDYIVGNAVAADQAPAILTAGGLSEETTVVATYIIPSLYDKIHQGQVAGAPSDLTVIQGRMAVDMMARLFQGEMAGRDFPFRSGPFIPMVTTENIGSYPYEGLFGPRGYKPVFSLDTD